MNYGHLGKAPIINISINGNEELYNKFSSKLNLKLPTYGRNDKVVGNVNISPSPGKRISHQGISIRLFGEFKNESMCKVHRFMEKTQNLVPPGMLVDYVQAKFEFEDLDFPTGTYYGSIMSVIYGVEVVVSHMISDFVVEKEFIVLFSKTQPEKKTFQENFGIKKDLMLEIFFPKSNYDICEQICGGILFLIAKIRISKILISFHRYEVYEDNVNYIKKRTQIKTYEIVDGDVVKGDFIPFRVFIHDCNIWPYTRFKDSPLKVESYARIQIIDENNKSYYQKLKLNFDLYGNEE